MYIDRKSTVRVFDLSLATESGWAGVFVESAAGRDDGATEDAKAEMGSSVDN